MALYAFNGYSTNGAEVLNPSLIGTGPFPQNPSPLHLPIVDGQRDQPRFLIVRVLASLYFTITPR
jgi:hypothetical protein